MHTFSRGYFTVPGCGLLPRCYNRYMASGEGKFNQEMLSSEFLYLNSEI